MIRLVAILSAAALLAAAEPAVAPAYGLAEDAMRRLAADADGVVTVDPRVRCWDAQGRLRWMEQGPPIGTQDGDAVAVGGGRIVVVGGHRIQVLARRDGRELCRAEVDRFHALADDGSWIAAEGNDGGLRLLAVGDGGVAVHPGPRLPGPVHGAWFAPPDRMWIGQEDGSLVQLVLRDGTWTLDGIRRLDLPGCQPGFTCLAPCRSADGAWRLATAHAADGGPVVAFWPVPLPEHPAPSRRLDGIGPLPVHSLVPGPAGRLAATFEDGSRTAPPCIIDEAGAKPHSDDSSIRQLAWSGARLVVQRWRGHPTIEAPGEAAPLASLEGPRPAAPVRGLARSTDGRRLYAGTPAGLAVWDLALLRLEAWIPGSGGALHPTADPGAAAWRDDAGAVHLIDLAGGRSWMDAAIAPGPGFAWSPDLRSVARFAGASVEVLAAADGRRLAAMDLPPPGDSDGADRLAWSADGARLLAVRSARRSYVFHGGLERTPWRWTARVLTPAGGAASPAAEGAGGGDQVAISAAGLPAETAPGAPEPAAVAEPGGRLGLPPAADGTWTSRLAVAVGALDEVVVARAGGPPVHLLAAPDAWALWDDAGRHDGSRGAGRLLSASLDGVPGSLEAAQATACRPEVLFAELGCDDRDLLAAAGRWHERRAGRGSAGPPRLVLAGSSVADGTLACELDAAAGAGALARVVARVDGVETASRPVDGRAAHAALRIALPPWPSTVELLAVAADGAASWPVRLDAPPGVQAAGRIVAACLGVSRYRDPRLALRFAAKDAVDVALALAEARPEREAPLVRWWTDGQVVPDALAGLATHLAQARPQDLAVVYVAGHGLHLRNPAPEWNLLGWDADPDDPARGAIAWPRLTAAFAGCPALRRLVILDTCEAGADDDAAPPAGDLRVAGTRGLRAHAWRAEAGLAGAWLAHDRERWCTADLALGAGAVVLASSRGGESSFESEPDANGLFTQALLEGLRGAADADGDGRITTAELAGRLAAEVARRSGGRQRPTIDRDNAWAAIALPVLAPPE